MTPYQILFYALISFIITLMCYPIHKKLKLPLPVFAVLTGFILSEIYTHFGFDTGIRASNFHYLSQYIFIPMILFAASFTTKPKMLLNDSPVHFIFAIPVTFITIGLTTVLLYYGIGYPEGFPWLAAFLTATILAMTGAHAIEDFLEQLNISKRLIHILQVESLFSAIIAILLYNFASSMLIHHQAHEPWLLAGEFLMHIAGGILVGIIIGLVTIITLKYVKEIIAQALLVITFVYSAYILCEQLGISGDFSVFTLGFLLGPYCRKLFSDHQSFVSQLIDTLYLFAICGLFILVGTTITWEMFSQRWLAMLVGIIAMLLARAASVFFGLGFYNCFAKKSNALSLSQQNILFWSGVRAALPIALAFGIPESLSYWWTIQSITFGVVLFGIFIQAPLVRFMSSNQT